MKYTKMGLAYHDQEDIGRFCTLCKSAYYNDWSIQDCDYCVLLKILKKQQDYAVALGTTLSLVGGAVPACYGDEICDKLSEDKKC